MLDPASHPIGNPVHGMEGCKEPNRAPTVPRVDGLAGRAREGRSTPRQVALGPSERHTKQFAIAGRGFMGV